MKITRVEPICLRMPEVAMRADGSQDTFIVRIHTDEGVTGVGEADSSPEVMRAIIEAPASHSLLSGLGRLLVGEDPFEIERLWDKMYQGAIFLGRRGAVIHAISAVDIALHDLMGRALGVPVWKLLGGKHRDRVQVYSSVLWGDTPDETARKAERGREAGYRAFKFGWGPFGRDLGADVEHVRIAREVIGQDKLLLVDAGCCYDSATAIGQARRFERYDIFWLEEALPADDREGYRRLCEGTDVRIAAGEQDITRFDFAELMDLGVDVVQPDIARTGGFTETKRIARMAADRGRLCVPHAWKTEILASASVHMVASMPQGRLVEYSTERSPMARDLTTGTLAFGDGTVTVPDAPGLGVELDMETVERYRVG